MAAVLGIDLGGTKLLIHDGTHHARFPTGPDFTPGALVDALRGFVAAHGGSPSAVGLAVPALVDVDGRIATCDVLPHFSHWQALPAMEALGWHSVVVNDVKAALAEEFHDAGPDLTGAVVMSGTAIGAAFLVHGRPLLGACGWAGELGYLPMPDGDRSLRLDDRAGGAAIASALGLQPADVASQASDGVPHVLAAIRSAGEAFGIALATVVNLFNPERIAVGGGTARLPGYLDAALRSAQSHSLPECWRACTVAPVRTGPDVVVLGARRLAQAEGIARTQ